MSTDIDYDFPRESMEYVFFEELLLNGLPPTGDVQYALTRGLQRPREEDWTPTVEINGRKCFLLPGTLDSGRLKVWARIDQSPELTVVEAGYITIT